MNGNLLGRIISAVYQYRSAKFDWVSFADLVSETCNEVEYRIYT